jgi:hypothetical protein
MSTLERKRGSINSRIRESTTEYIGLIEETLIEYDSVKAHELLQEIHAFYLHIIDGFSKGLNNYSQENEYGTNNYTFKDDNIKEDFRLIKSKLRAFIDLQCNVDLINKRHDGQGINVVQYSTQQLKVSFEIEIRTVLENLDGVSGRSYEEIEEIKKKFLKIQKIVEGKETRNKKWSLIKEITKGILDKGIDIGAVCLPYIVSTLGKI